ncbi:MAG: hypothetical protein M5U17_15935 [Ignavibacterium sp.]|nr:hypothetical protein [Ignavibacterium sp.]
MISEIISFQNKGVISVVEFATIRANTIEYISGSNAIKQNFIEVKEISQTGSVNNLVIHNNSDKYIFFSDGDILSGAKQNRILNSSVFIAPNMTKNIPVSCVEQGRWRHISPNFLSTDYSAPTNIRAKKSYQVEKSLEKGTGHFANQGEIWNDVNYYCKINTVNSPTSNLSDVFEKKIIFEDSTRDIKPSEKANGIAVFINRNLIEAEVFNRKDIYYEYFPKILRGVSSEAFHFIADDKKLDEAEAKYKTIDFFDELENRKFKVYPGVCAGNEKRYESNQWSGFALEFGEHLIHLAMMNLVK